MTPLTQQLEDKKKGCAKGKELLKQRLEDKDNKYIADFIKENWKKELVCCQNNLCPSCQAEIAILEQAIAEIDDLCNKLFEKDLLLQKQRQNFIDIINSLGEIRGKRI